MSKIIVIGGSGHVGGYLVPSLIEAGNQVVNVTRGRQKPYRDHAAWSSVETVILDREAEDKAGTFGPKISALGGDIVIDMICFTLESAQHLCEALDGKISHFLHTGSIWVHGHSLAVPTCENDRRLPFGEYGMQKSAIEDYLLARARQNGFPATVVRPGHIVGPGWNPLNPAGHFDPKVFSEIAGRQTLSLPNFGLETVHHVHAEDVAQMFLRAIENWGASVGESFNAVSPAALTLRGYAEAMYRWFGHDPQLNFAPFDEWAKAQADIDAAATLEHIRRSPCHSIEKARRLLRYTPRYSSLEAVQESVQWLIGNGMVNAGKLHH